MPFIDCAGGFSDECAGDAFFGSNTFPKQQESSSFSLTKGPFAGSLRRRWIAGINNLEDEINTLLSLPVRPLAVQSVPAKHMSISRDRSTWPRVPCFAPASITSSRQGRP